MVPKGSHAIDGTIETEADIRVAVVDDHALVRSGICRALELDPKIEVAGEAGDGLAAIELLEQEAVDVILLDLRMPLLDGLGCLDVLVKRWPDKPVIILTVDEDRETALEAMRRGAAAYVPKFVRPADLASIVRQVVGGSILMGGPRLLDKVVGGGESAEAGPAETSGLTKRELEVLALVAQGKANAEIAKALFITTKTVKYHLHGIFTTLGTKNRTEAAAYAITQGLVLPSGSVGGGPPTP